MKTARVLVWDLPVRAFHWLLALSFAGAYLLSDTERLRDIHVMFGYTALGLVVFRVFWGFAGSRYARFRSFLHSPRETLDYLRSLPTGAARRYLGHNPAGSLAIWAIISLALMVGVSGWATYNDLGGEDVGELHEFLSNAWLAVVAIHIAGVLASSLMHRENLPASMVTGCKAASPGAGITGSARAAGVLVVVAVLAFWAFSLAGDGKPPPETAAASLIATGP